MNKQEYLDFHRQFCVQMCKLTEKKNADYTGVSDNAFNNVCAGEKLGVGTTEQGLLFRMLDKVSRVISFIRTEGLEVKEESIVDTLLDLANYSVMLAGYLSYKQQRNEESK